MSREPELYEPVDSGDHADVRWVLRHAGCRWVRCRDVQVGDRVLDMGRHMRVIGVREQACSCDEENSCNGDPDDYCLEVHFRFQGMPDPNWWDYGGDPYEERPVLMWEEHGDGGVRGEVVR